LSTIALEMIRLILLILITLWVLPVHAFLTDTTIRAVPDDGSTYDRDTWNPTNGTFPAVGGTYVDPVFGETIRRLTAIHPSGGTGLNNHHQWNADGTKFFWQNANQVHILDGSTGTQLETNIPGGFGAGHDSIWSPHDPNIYYYNSLTTNISQRNISTDTTSTVKNFGATLGSLGNKGPMVAVPADDTANPTNLLFLVSIGGTLRVWDQARDTILGGTMVSTDIRWAALSPDGRWIILSQTSGDFYSLPVNVMAGTVGDGVTAGQTGTLFWDSMCFDHAAIASLTNGKTYLLTGACLFERYHYRVDVSLNQAGRTQALQAADNLRLFQTDASGQTGNSHYTCAHRGSMRNYCMASNEDTAETIAAPGTWYAHKQEVVLVYMLTGKVYRLAHHRSYPLLGGTQFCGTPRINMAPDGTHAFFMSGFGLVDAEATCGYSDVYRLDMQHVTTVKPWTRRPSFTME
jgi:hypothetical protein